MFYVYIIRNSAGQFYTGHTEDIDTRLANHNRCDKILGKFTRKNGPWTMVWTEEHLDRASAMRRERLHLNANVQPLLRESCGSRKKKVVVVLASRKEMVLDLRRSDSFDAARPRQVEASPNDKTLIRANDKRRGLTNEQVFTYFQHRTGQRSSN